MTHCAIILVTVKLVYARFWLIRSIFCYIFDWLEPSKFCARDRLLHIFENCHPYLCLLTDHLVLDNSWCAPTYRI